MRRELECGGGTIGRIEKWGNKNKSQMESEDRGFIDRSNVNIQRGTRMRGACVRAGKKRDNFIEHLKRERKKKLK